MTTDRAGSPPLFQPAIRRFIDNQERYIIAALLTLSTILGVAFSFIVPTWANVEEPTHFEYIRFIVDHHRLPQPGDADPELQQQIIESYIWASHIWGLGGKMRNQRVLDEWDIDEPTDWQRLREALSTMPEYEDLSARTWTSKEQFGEAPGYYLIAAVPQFFLSGASIETQLITARIVSVLLGMLSVWLSALTARELFPNRKTLRIAVPALVALQPSFVVLQSSVNNTIAAVAALTLTVYSVSRWVHRGYSPLNLLLMILSGAVCVYSKTTAYIGIIILLAALPLARRKAWSRWVSLAPLAPAIAMLLLFSWQRPANWYPASNRAVAVEDAPLGDHIISFTPGEYPQTLWQTFPSPVVQSLQGQTLTFGLWMRAEGAPFEAQLPTVWTAPNEGQLTSIPASPEQASVVSLTSSWQFYAVEFTIPEEAQCMALRFSTDGDATSRGARAYDGLVLARGERPLDEPPTFDNEMGTSGEWGDMPFDNLLRNASAERGQPLFRPTLIPRSVSFADTPLNLNMQLATFFDIRGNAPTLLQSLRWLFSSFWARFGWTSPGLPVWAIAGLAILSGISVLGLVRYVLQQAYDAPLWQRRALTLVALAGVGVVGMAVFRIDPINLPSYCDYYQGRFISTGYYIVPGMLPLMLLWYLGLEAWLPEHWHRIFLAAVVMLFFAMTMGMLFERMIPSFLSAYAVVP